MIQTFDKTGSNYSNPRILTIFNRHFHILEAQLEILLKKLYDLGGDDEIIPYIKGFYEAN